jgi:hypothetical protein
MPISWAGYNFILLKLPKKNDFEEEIDGHRGLVPRFYRASFHGSGLGTTVIAYETMDIISSPIMSFRQ